MTAYAHIYDNDQANMLIRIDDLRAGMPRMDMATLLAELYNMRITAMAQDMSEFVAIIRSFEGALARSRCDTMALHYLDALADAVSVTVHTAQATDSLLASLAVYGVR